MSDRINSVGDCLRHAEECEAMARKATSLKQREMITNMAETWRMLADRQLKRRRRRRLPESH